MKDVFFINPAAGQGKGIEELKERIHFEAESLSRRVEIFMTNSVGDGEKAARRMAEELDGEEGRFYACGGDGTANEIINGIHGFGNVSLGIIPIGTGNDTVRNFAGGTDFMDIKAQMTSEAETVDLMKYDGIIDGRRQVRYAVNMFNIGFDCNVVELAGRLKQKPMIKGSFAYLMAVLGMFIQKKGTALKITSEGEVIRDGEMLLCAVANGSYCGGGVCSAPQAKMNDGLFDLSIINDVSRTTFLRLFPKYQKGTHFQTKGVDRIIEAKAMKEVTLEPRKAEDFFLCADGEIALCRKVTITAEPGGLRLIIPKKSVDNGR